MASASDFKQSHRRVEARHEGVPYRRERQLLAGAEVRDDAVGEDLAGLRAATDAGGRLDGRAKEVIVFGDGLSGAGDDAAADHTAAPFLSATILRIGGALMAVPFQTKTIRIGDLDMVSEATLNN